MSVLRQETVLGLDNVALDLPVAAFPMRVLASLLDYVLFFIVVIVFYGAAGTLVVISDVRSAWILALALLAYFVLEYGYFVGLEILMGGQTPGKRVFGLRVTTTLGGEASRGAILIRNALRIVDLSIGVPFMMAHPLTQRIGDRLAGTLVLHVNARASESIVRRVPPDWGVGEIAVAEELLRRSAAMHPGDAQRLARRLLEVIEARSPGFITAVQRDPLDTLRAALGASEERP